MHKEYKCFHPSSKKFLISRHETNHHNTIPSPTQHAVSIFDSWLPRTNSNSCADPTTTTFVSTLPCSSSLVQSLALQLPVVSLGQPEQPSLLEDEHLESQHSQMEPNLELGPPTSIQQQ